MVKILTNTIKCAHCNDIIESKHRHDFVTCQCGKVSVDGGKDYLKRNYLLDGDFVELSTFEIQAIDFWRLMQAVDKYKEAAEVMVSLDELQESDNGRSLDENQNAYLEASAVLEDTIHQIAEQYYDCKN